MVFRALLQIYRIGKSQFKKTIILDNQLVSGCLCALNIRDVSTALNLLTLRKSPEFSQLKKSNTEKNCNNNRAKAIISSLNLKNVEDAAPFYTLPISSLYQIRRTTLADVRNGFCENRLYYISSRIQCPPATLSEKLVKRIFVYKLSFQWIENSLNELLDKGVPGDRILRDLWVLKYHHITIRDRLQKIKDHGVESLFPWMVRCSPDILHRYLKITQETKSILGETKTTQIYLANRLNISPEAVEEMCMKMPTLRNIRATKLKHFLDFLIEEGFDTVEIANKPRILGSSQKTAKKRLEELRQLGVTNINLNVLCRSKKAFRRLYECLKHDNNAKHLSKST